MSANIQSQTKSLIDTQVLSVAFKEGKSGKSLPSTIIASSTAKELLLAQSLNSEKPLYYVLHPAIYEHVVVFGDSDLVGNPKWAKMSGRHRTDEIAFYLGNQFLAYREYGDQALALLINNKIDRVFKMSIAHLPKYRQKYLIDRWQYLIENDFSCLPLNDATVEVGLTMFAQFLEKNKPKASVANTVLDMMIFATAVQNQLRLYTLDKLLASFAAEFFGAPVVTDGDMLVVDFTTEEVKTRRLAKESKGYINRGWNFSIRSQRAVSGR